MTVLNLKGLVARHATFADIREIVDGGWENHKGRLGIGRDR